PLINSIGEVVAGGMGAINPFAALPPEAIFTEYVRPIGIGAIAMAGIIGILKSSRVIGTAFKLAFGGLFGGSQMDTSAHEERTDKDIKMTFILIFSLLTMVMIFVFLLSGVDVTPWQAVVAFLTVTIIAFLFTTVAANAIAIVGTNPVSGMTLMTLILSSFVLVQAGLKGETGMISALIIGGIVCTALSMAGGFITDLKIGYWLGSTPKKQESWKFLGTLVSAATVGAVIFILNEAYGFTYTEATPDPLVAPQANAMAAVIQPLMSEAEINWMLYIVGAVIALLLNFIGISPLAFALGMYLPLHLNTPLLVGGLLSHFIKKSSKDEKLVQARNQKGTLIASGFIAGAAIFGVIGALLKFFNFDLDINPWSEGSHGPEILAMIMFAAIIIFFARFAMSAKPEE
ncbi:MAG: OPT/YSL family transporter, partial [Bacteroidota bacterium]